MGSVIRFDYLHDEPSALARAFRTARLPRRLHNVAAALVTVTIAVMLAAGIERVRVNAARDVEAQAARQFDRSRSALNALAVQFRQLDRLLALDRRLRQIRLSGTIVSGKVAQLGNALPQGAWLDSMSAAPASYTLKGNVDTIASFATALQGLIAERSLGSPNAVRISHQTASPFTPMAFSVDGKP